MRTLLVLVFVVACVVQSASQTCTNCADIYHNYIGDIKVKNNQSICITGTFSGNIDLMGGELKVCGDANINQINYKQPSLFTITENARVTIQSIAGHKAVSLVNYCDSLVIVGGVYDEHFALTNYGKAYIQSGVFNNTILIENFDTLNCNTSINMKGETVLRNTGYFVIHGNLIPNNSNIILDNQCQFQIMGDLSLNSGSLVNVNAGYMRVNNININLGKITLRESSILYVNQLNVVGSIEGEGSRSTVVCTREPNLISKSSITGNLSLCVKGSAFNPKPGAVQIPASVDCTNPIPSSKCNPEGFGYAYFRMLPQESSDWANSNTWEMQYSYGWAPAPEGRYPTAGSAVLIGDGKKMTVGRNVVISKLILGELITGGRLVLDSTQSIEFKVEDTIITNMLSGIELNRSHLNLHGIQDGDLNLKGGDLAKLTLNLLGINGVAKMDKSVPGSSNRLNTLSFDLIGAGPIEVADTLYIVSSVHPNGGVLKTNNNLILESSATSTAYIAVGPELGNYIKGNVTIQQYIPSVARRYRFVTPSVNNTTLLDWQQETFITGNNALGTATGTTVGQLNSVGFDATSTNEPSTYWYDESAGGDEDNGWVAVTNETSSLADYTLPVGKGYRLFIRGDRSDLGRLDGSNNTQNEVVMNTKGVPNMGEITIPVDYHNLGPTLWDNGWNLIGNPYPSNIDWKMMVEDNAVHPNIEPIVWTYNPKTNAYISYNALTGAGTLQGGLIASGQSFWVKANGPATPIVLKEKYKSSNTTFLEPRVEDNRGDEVRISLYKDSINENSIILKSKTGSTAAKDQYDILKYWGGEVGISFYNDEDTTYLELSTRPPNYSVADTLKLYFYVDVSGTYELRFSQSVPTLFRAFPQLFLFDKFTNTYTGIDQEFVYSFNVDVNDAASIDPFRFSLVMLPSSPPSTEINYFFATASDTSTVLLEWGSKRELTPTTYIVERGPDSTHFTVIGTVQGTGSEKRASDYDFLDTAITGFSELYYRIGAVDSVDATPNYTTVIRINLNTGEKEVEESATDIHVFPNPVSNMLTIQTIGFVSQSMKIDVVDITGKQWISQRFAPQGQDKVRVDLASLPQGLYLVQIQSADGKVSRQRILKD